MSGRPGAGALPSMCSGSSMIRVSVGTGVWRSTAASSTVRSWFSGRPSLPANWISVTRAGSPSETWNTTTARVPSPLRDSRGSTRTSGNPR